MGRILLLCRLAGRDLRRRPAQAALMLLAIMAATTTLTLALALHGVTSRPYQQTRAATAAPDVVAQLISGPHGLRVQRNAGPEPAQVQALVHAPGVTGYSGPYPVIGVILRARGISTVAEAEGRNQAPASIDQPKLTRGSWVRGGGVVIERTFADALGVRTGDRITLNGRPSPVAGIASPAPTPPYPNLCHTGCSFSIGQLLPQEQQTKPGLIWLTQPDARSLATAPLSFLLNLRLKDPASAQAFASAHDSRNPAPTAPFLVSWQAVRTADGLLVTDEQQV